VRQRNEVLQPLYQVRSQTRLRLGFEVALSRKGVRLASCVDSCG
jgi:hypothetical protein